MASETTDSIQPRVIKWAEVLAVVLVVALALFLRLWRIDLFPPGVHYDEVIDLWDGLRISSGEYFLYTPHGWGREALYYYLLALVLKVVPYNLLALRLTAVACSIGAMWVTYCLVCRQTKPIVAWLTLAWYAVLFWSVFLGRSGNRAIILPLMVNLTILAFWWAWDTRPDQSKHKMRRYLCAGVLFGATMYTYQPARFVPFLFFAFILYAALFHRQRFCTDWRGFGVFFVVTALVSAPLIATLLANPGAEGHRDWTIEPYTQLMSGNVLPVWQNMIATAKMFSISGDPLVSYNVPGRPLFVPTWTGVFFYAGLALALWRWRRPFYAFALIWLGVMLAPTILTISAPNHLRAAAALPPITLLAALALGEFIDWAASRWGRTYAAISLALVVAALVLTGRATWQDYFVAWPEAKPKAWENMYNAPIISVIDHLRSDPDPRPVAISSRNIVDAHPFIVDTILERDDLAIRWMDTFGAFAMPAGHDEVRLFVTKRRWIDDDLFSFIGLGAMPVTYEDDFALFEARFSDWDVVERLVYALPASAPFPTDLLTAHQMTLPVTIENTVQLESIRELPPSLNAGQTLTFFSTWQVLSSTTGKSLAMFVHLLNDNGELVAQQDGLGYPLHTWQPGDRFVHVHHISAGASLPAGQYWIQLGFYEGTTGQRWLIRDNERVLGDRLLVGAVEVSRE
ncbi:MAG: glycosyltransferase family 39 protein [Chloroflexi bacterium]|nr:glycosyltransferase family 39 protein [Chloroflexota bacterium]